MTSTTPPPAQNSPQRLHRRQHNRELADAALRRAVDDIGHTAGIRSRSTSDAAPRQDALECALRLLAEHCRLPFRREDIFLQTFPDERARLRAFVDAAGWRLRPVHLDAEGLHGTIQPVLAFRRSTGSPLVILPSGNGTRVFDPTIDARPWTPDADLSDDLEQDAFCVHERLPADSRSPVSLARFILVPALPMLRLFVAAGLLVSLLGLLMPIATQYITGKVIPTANLSELWQLATLLCVLSVSQLLLGAVPALQMLVFGTRQYERFQAAVFDHVLRIPVQTFQICGAGDMVQRVLGAADMQQTFFGVISGQFLGAFFSLAALGMMFWYSPSLALAGLLLTLLYAGCFLLLLRRNLRPLGIAAAAAGRTGGFLKQMLDGMSKIRAADAEQRVLVRFLQDFGEQLRQGFQMQHNEAVLHLLHGFFPMIISLVFYGMVAHSSRESLPLPVFLAFMSAFQSFQGGVLGLSAGLWQLLAMRPELERLRPVLEAVPEDAADRQPPGTLRGQVKLAHVSFRYAPDAPLVLKDVSLEAEPGEFIAIVGPSGSGKSTLVRLLLGFEQPESGSVYYDGKDLALLDQRAVRRQLGCILQTARIQPGSILDNVTAGAALPLDNVREALRLAALDEDIEALPMNVHTIVTPETISGGQQQRLLIARALAASPSIVIMDESTSALDNLSQETVRRHMDALHMTRIVIAHRLSTIIRADRIYVMEAGRIVQQGTYDALRSQEGLFRRLVERQSVEVLP